MPKKLPAKALPPPPRLKFKAVLETTMPTPTPLGLAASVSERAPTKTKEPKPHTPEPELDTASRTAAVLAPPAPLIAPSNTCPLPDGRGLPLRDLATELLEKAAFWGDGHRGVARLRFGKSARGGLAGASVTLEHDGDAIALRVDGVDDATIDRLREQLAARGIELRES